LSALMTVVLRARRATPWRARLAADLMFAMEQIGGSEGESRVRFVIAESARGGI